MEIFSKHYEAIRLQRSKEKIVLVAICDPNEKLLNKINIKNTRKYKRIKDLINNEKLDIISILTPSILLQKCYEV